MTRMLSLMLNTIVAVVMSVSTTLVVFYEDRHTVFVGKNVRLAVDL
jgi:hypothetical protein